MTDLFGSAWFRRADYHLAARLVDACCGLPGDNRHEIEALIGSPTAIAQK